jgi:hypothetical protein
MVIDQRNAGASVTITGTNASDYVIDRWFARAISATGSKISVQRSTVAPTGFINSQLVTSLSAYTLGSSESFGVMQAIEGFNVADLGWGTANAQTITISFKVRSSLTGTFGGFITNEAGNRCYVFSYTINSANTFEDKSITILGDTTGTWQTNTSAGITIAFSVGAGSSVTGSAGSWGSTLLRSVTGQTSLVGTNGATFYITGVQLEVGSTATSFDYRPYGTELALCQRYYWKTYAQSTVPATVVSDGSIAMMANTSGFAVGSPIYFPAEMRAAPTITYYSPTTGATGNWRRAAGAADVAVANYVNPSTRSLSVYNTAGGTNGEGIYGHVVAAIEL